MSFESLRKEWGKRNRDACRAENYVTADRTVRSTSIMAPPEMRENYYTRVTWVSMVTAAIEERVSVVDQVASTKRISQFLRDSWRDADGDLVASRVHRGALDYGRGYVAVDTNPATGSPRMTYLSAKSTVHTLDPDTGMISEALRLYGPNNSRAVYYERGRMTRYRNDTTARGWVQDGEVEETGYERCPIVLFSYAAPVDGYGDPIAKPIYNLQDAGCRVATDGSICGALLATPQRAIFGAASLAGENPEDLYMARILEISEPTAKIEQFAAAQLQQFGTLLSTFARQAAAIMGVPVNLFGVASEANPSSTDSARQEDGRITRRAERITRDFTTSWEQVLDILLDYFEGTVTDKVRRSATVEWLDASKPTGAEVADQAVKLAGAKHGDQPLLSKRFILRRMGLTPEEIDEELDAGEESLLEAMMRGADDDDTGSTGETVPPLDVTNRPGAVPVPG